LSNLSLRRIGQRGKVLHAVFESKSGDLAIQFGLDFGDERLNFSLFEGLAFKDDGSPESADAFAEVRRFQNEYFGNGQLHIVDAATGNLISRKDAYVPVNMWLDHERGGGRSRALEANRTATTTVATGFE